MSNYTVTVHPQDRLITLYVPGPGHGHQSFALNMPEARDLLNALQASIDTIDRRDADQRYAATLDSVLATTDLES